MARLGIDDQFWLEIVSVVAKMGDQDRAIGNAVRWFRFAQEKHKHGRLVTEDEFKVNGFDESLIPLFATRVDGGIKCIGAEKHFSWLAKKVAAGRKGGQSTSEAKRSTLKQNQAKDSTTEASPSFSPSYSSTPKPSRKVPTEPQKAKGFIAAYCDRFKRRWGESPQILGKDAGIAKRLAKDLSQDRFEYFLDAFFQMPDSWLVKVKHPLAAFETKLNEVVVFAESGQFTTSRQAHDADNMATNHLLMEKLKREGR